MQPSKGTVRSMRHYPIRGERVPVWSAGSAAEVERDLDGTGAVLGGERGERVAPLVERERVGEHAGEVDAPACDEVEVVLDPVALDAVDHLEAERVRAHPRDLLEVERRPLPAGGAVYACLHQRAA